MNIRHISREAPLRSRASNATESLRLCVAGTANGYLSRTGAESRSRTGQRSGRPLFPSLILSLHQLMHRPPRLQRRPGGNGQESPVRRGPPTSIGFTLLLPQKVGAAFQVDMKKCSASKRDTSHIQTLAVWRPVDLRHAAPSLHNQIRCGPTCSGQKFDAPLPRISSRYSQARAVGRKTPGSVDCGITLNPAPCLARDQRHHFRMADDSRVERGISHWFVSRLRPISDEIPNVIHSSVGRSAFIVAGGQFLL